MRESPWHRAITLLLPEPLLLRRIEPGLIDMGHLEFPEDLFHLNINILGQMVLNHKETRQVLGLQKRFNAFMLIRKRSAGLLVHFTHTRL